MKETVDCLKYNNDGKLLAIGTMDGKLYIYEI